MAPGNAPLALKRREHRDDLAPSHFQLSLPLTLHEMGTQQGGVKWVEEPVQLGVISNQGPALKGSRRLRVSDSLGSVYHLEGKRLSKLDFLKKGLCGDPLLGHTNMNSNVIFKVGPSFLRVGPGSYISRSIPDNMDQSLAPGVRPAQKTAEWFNSGF